MEMHHKNANKKQKKATKTHKKNPVFKQLIPFFSLK